MKNIDSGLIRDLISKASDSPRRRSHHNIHDDMNGDIQRLLIAMQPDTYIRPHRHPEEYKKEMLILLKGSCLCATFSDEGKLLNSTTLSLSGNLICEFPDQVFHSIICLEEDTVLLEVKRGPYEPLPPDSFASWAPAEGEEGTAEWQKKLLEAAGTS